MGESDFAKLQKSVLIMDRECKILYAAQCKKLKSRLCVIMNEEKDSLRLYYLGNNYSTKIEHYGAKSSYKPEGVLLI